MTTNPITQTDEAALLDDHAVDLMAKAMKEKLRLKRAQGFSGWDDISTCTGERLAELLVASVAKGDPVDVSNFAMMLLCRQEDHEALKTAYAAAATEARACTAQWAEFPAKCPITRRDFFMVIGHPELGMVPTYGGPYDSYTIPEMEGDASTPFHERELFVRRYDHDRGYWVDDESIPMKVISESALQELQEAAEAPVQFDFAAHLARQSAFSLKTFGPGSRTAGVVDHIRKELKEIEADPGDLKEWVDVVILALDGAWRSGATPEEIISAVVAKQTKNEGRTWPDWRTADPTKAIEHDRSGETTSTRDSNMSPALAMLAKLQMSDAGIPVSPADPVQS